VHFSYRRHLENELRRRFPIGPTPIRLLFRARRDRGAPEA
jgi:predicted GTPase